MAQRPSTVNAMPSPMASFAELDMPPLLLLFLVAAVAEEESKALETVEVPEVEDVFEVVSDVVDEDVWEAKPGVNFELKVGFCFDILLDEVVVVLASVLPKVFWAAKTYPLKGMA